MDPNAEVIKTKGTRYVNSDWSEVSRTKKAGLQEVAVETVVYADGRVKEFILDGSGQRFADPVRQDFDEDQRKAWDAQKKDQPVESNAPAARRTAREEAEIAANAALPLDQDPRAETNADRSARADRTIKEQGERARQDEKDAETRTRQAAQDARQARIDEQNAATQAANASRAASAEARAAAAAVKPENKTETITGGDGKRYTRVTTVAADGKTVTIKNFGPDGKEVTEIPGDNKGNFGVEPEGAPQMQYTAGQLSAGLRTYSTWLSSQVKLYTDSGGTQGVSPDQATKLMERRIGLAESALKEQEGLGNAQKGLLDNATTQRGQSLNETQSRRSAAQGILTNSQSNILPLVRYAGKGGGGLAVDAMNAALERGRGYVDSFGGFRESPEVNPDSFPALAELRRSSMAGIQTAAQGGPQIFGPQAVMAPPPAAGGAPLLPPRPEAQVSASAPVVPPAANPISGTPITLPPQPPNTPAPLPVSTAAEPPARANIPAAVAAPAPVVPPFMKPNLQSELGLPGEAGAASDPTINDTNYTVPPVPPPVYQVEQGPDPAQYGNGGDMQRISMLPPSRMMQETRYGPGNYWNPEQHGAELAARLGMDPAVFKMAVEGMYG